MINPGQIQIVKGGFNETCTLESNLIANQLKFPAIRDIIQYAERRPLVTLLVSGARTEYQTKTVETKIPKIPSDKLVGDSGYRYLVQGRIQRPSVVVEQVGTSGTDGSFSLRMKDNILYPGINVRLYSDKHARVQGQPTGSNGNFVYSFKTLDGQPFDFATDLQPNGEKTLFPAYSTYSDRSLRGYSRTWTPDWFINHTSVKRKTTGISGSGATDVLWVMYNGQKGWMYYSEQQARVVFLAEDEYEKWDGESTMKNPDGTLKNVSTLIDPETGLPVTAGDGVIPQISGYNVFTGSDSDGLADIDDHEDMMTTLEKKGDQVYGNEWIVVTGTNGYAKAQRVLENKASRWLRLQKEDSAAVGGPSINVGYMFESYNFAGNKVTFVKHPLFDNDSLYTKKNSRGNTARGSSYIYLNFGNNDNKNIEILTKGAFGVNRSMISNYLNGITGLNEAIATGSVDAIEYQMLKEDMICVYNPRTCGIINADPNK